MSIGSLGIRSPAVSMSGLPGTSKTERIRERSRLPVKP